MEIFPSGTLNGFPSAIVFQSKFCKIRFWTVRDRPYEDPEIYFAYGRLHAPNEKHAMTWNGREYHCWHNHLFLYIVLGFLVGLSAQEIAKTEYCVLTYVLNDERVTLPLTPENLEKTANLWGADMVQTWFAKDKSKIFFYVPQIAVYQPQGIPVHRQDMEEFIG